MMSVTSLFKFKESGVVYIFFRFLMKFKMFSEEKLFQAGQKITKVLVKNIFINW